MAAADTTDPALQGMVCAHPAFALLIAEGTKGSGDMFMCLVCSQGFRNLAALEHHASKHTRQTPPAKRHVRSGPRASQACHACAVNKTRCDNNVRCKRCTRKNIPCVRDHPIQETSAWNDIEPSTVALQTPSNTVAQVMGLNNFIVDPQLDGTTTQPDLLAQAGSGIVDNTASAQMCSDPTLSATPIGDGLPATNLYNDGTGLFQGRFDFNFNFNSAYNFFDFAGDHDVVLSAQDHDFLSSLPLQPPADPADSYPATSLMTGSDHSSSQAVYEAFRQSVGRWEPDGQHHRTTEEHALLLDRTVTSRMDCLGEWNPEIVSQILSPGIREKLLKTLIRTCNHDNVIDIISSFPAVEVLDRLFKSYLTRQATITDSWIHVPTLDVNDVRLELLIGCLAAAAMLSSSRAVQKFGLAMQEFLVFYLWQEADKDNAMTRNIQYLQAFALQLEIGLWSGVRRKMEMSESFSGILTNPLRAAGYFRFSNYPPPAIEVNDEGEILEMKWKRWVHEESFKRLVYHTHLYSSRMSLVTFGTSTMSYAELSLPVPYAKELWLAKTALDWKRTYFQLVGNGQLRPHCFIDLLPDPMALHSLGNLYDHYHIQLCLLHAASDMICRYRQDRTIFAAAGNSSTRVSAFSDQVQQQRILHILKHVSLSCEDLEAQRTIELHLLFHLFSMHLFAPFDQMELAAGKEGPREAGRADPSLQQWIQTGESRQAVWHAGQVLRATRQLGPEQFKHYYVVSAYHAGLCLWIYGMLSQPKKPEQLHAPEASGATEASGNSYVYIDQDETKPIQRWITYGRGEPAISSRSQDGTRNGADDIALGGVSIYSPQLLITTLLQHHMSRFVSKNGLFMDNICQLMQALRNISRRADEGANRSTTGI